MAHNRDEEIEQEDTPDGTADRNPLSRTEFAVALVRLLDSEAVQDRLLQQALLQMLTPVLDPGFADESYGFRPGRSAHDAIRAAQGHLAAGPQGWR